MKKFISTLLGSIIIIFSFSSPFLVFADTVPQLINTSVIGGTFSYFKLGSVAGTQELVTDKNGVSLFKNSVDCDASRKQYIFDNQAPAVTACVPSNTSFAATAHTITPLTTKTAANNIVYKLLAPIGNFTQMTAATDVGAYLNTIIKIAIGLCAVLAVIFIVIGGIQYMGDESIFGKTEAKSQITSAILGLLIALGSYAILNTINPDLLGGNGVNINSVSGAIEEETVPWSTYEDGGDKTLCPSGFVNIESPANSKKYINVCSTISDKLVYMINAAKRDGITLFGTGTRKVTTTQALRVKNNCPDPKAPSSSCHPDAVAIPGTSNHEKGLAVDFTCNGQSMHPDKLNTNNVCYQWLVKNAATYGFYNKFDLIKETWHWSTTGV